MYTKFVELENWVLTPNSRSYLNRWAQPDSIIPNSSNSIDWDRYSYSRNNPLRYRDPSGHRPTCEIGEDCEDVVGDYYFFKQSLDNQAAKYGINFTDTWTDKDKQAVLYAALIMGYAFQMSPSERSMKYLAFSVKSVFGGTNIEFVNYQCSDGCWGRAVDSHNIRLYSPASGKLDFRLVLHGFGHVFNKRVADGLSKGFGNGNYQTPYDALESTWNTDASFPRRGDEYDGFAGPPYGWQQSEGATQNEEFADMFLGWSNNLFAADEAGAARSSWMKQDNHMSIWTLIAISAGPY